MARPNKVGLEYFSLDVKFDDEVELIKAVHGIKGIGVLITMYQTIYADKGYYRKWNERNQILFSNKVSVDRNTVINVIDDCIKWDIFDKKIYEKYAILTSRRIQKQYIKATYKRTEVEVIEEYLLLKHKDIDRENITCISVTDIGNSDTSGVTDIGNSDTSGVSDGKSTHSNKDSNKDSNKKKKNISSLTSNEKIILNTLKSVELYPFDYEKDLEYIRELIIEFSDVDLVKQIKKWKTYKLDKPLKNKSNARLQIRNWIINASNWKKNDKSDSFVKTKKDDGFQEWYNEQI